MPFYITDGNVYINKANIVQLTADNIDVSNLISSPIFTTALNADTIVGGLKDTIGTTATTIINDKISTGTLFANSVIANAIISSPVIEAATIANGFSLATATTTTATTGTTTTGTTTYSYSYNPSISVVLSVQEAATDSYGIEQFRTSPYACVHGEGMPDGVITLPPLSDGTARQSAVSSANRINSSSPNNQGRVFTISGNFKVPWLMIEAKDAINVYGSVVGNSNHASFCKIDVSNPIALINANGSKTVSVGSLTGSSGYESFNLMFGSGVDPLRPAVSVYYRKITRTGVSDNSYTNGGWIALGSFSSSRSNSDFRVNDISITGSFFIPVGIYDSVEFSVRPVSHCLDYANWGKYGGKWSKITDSYSGITSGKAPPISNYSARWLNPLTSAPYTDSTVNSSSVSGFIWDGGQPYVFTAKNVNTSLIDGNLFVRSDNW